MNAHTFLDEAGRKAVLDAVARAEKRTAAEIACVVSTESGRYDRAESLVGLALGLVGLAAADAGWNSLSPSGGWRETIPLAFSALGVVVGFIAGLVLASYVHPIRRALVSKREQDDEVSRGAAAAFTRLKVSATKGSTGVLIYVSLFERQVRVLLDEGARRAGGDTLAAELCTKATAGLARGGRGEVLVGVIDAAAGALEKTLPPLPQDQNELPDRVVVLHPR